VVLNSATIGGVTAKIHVQKSDGTPSAGDTESGAAILSALVPSGTTATVVLNFNLSITLRTVATYQVLNLISDTPIDFKGSSGPNETLNTTCNVKKDGVVYLAGICLRNGTASLTGVTQDYAQSNISEVGGSLMTTADETPRSFSTIFGSPATAGANVHENVVASFR
jgi:hypothetical protein